MYMLREMNRLIWVSREKCSPPISTCFNSIGIYSFILRVEFDKYVLFVNIPKYIASDKNAII